MSHDHEHHHAPATGKPEDLAVCPVMDIEVNKKDAEQLGHVRTYNGKKYYFCCPSCLADFDKNPSSYV